MNERNRLENYADRHCWKAGSLTDGQHAIPGSEHRVTERAEYERREGN